MLIGMLFAALVLSLIGASEIHAWVVHDGVLGKQPALVRSAGALVDAAEATRAEQLFERLKNLVDDARPHVVWLRASHERLRPSPVNPIAEEDGARAPSRGTRTAIVTDETTRVLIIGASSMQLEFGAELERALESSYRHVQVERFGKLATGLVRPDYFDWQKKAADLVRDVNPHIVIAQFGGNDAQAISLRRSVLPFGTPEWDKEFGTRVSSLATLVQSRGARLIMLGMPMMREPQFSQRMEHVNAIMRRRVEEAGATFVSIWELSSARGDYMSSVVVNGQRQLLRATDGIHFTRAGAVYMTEKVLERIEGDLSLVPAAGEKAVVVRRNGYIAYVPQPAARGEIDLPVLYLFANWTDEAHGILKDLSARYGIIVAITNISQIWSTMIDVENRLPAAPRRGIAGGARELALTSERPGVFTTASSMSGGSNAVASTPDLPVLVTDGRWPEALPRHVAWHAERLGTLDKRAR